MILFHPLLRQRTASDESHETRTPKARGVAGEVAADLLLMHLARMLVLTWWYTVGGRAR